MTVRVTSHSAKDDERPRVRSLLTAHPQVALGWVVRGAGCAAWFAFTLGLTLLGESTGHGVLLAAVGLTSYSAAAVAGSGLGVLTASSRRPALINSLTWLVAGVGWLTMGLAPTAVVIGAAATIMGLMVPAGNAATMAMVTRSFTGLERRAALTAQTTVVTGSSTVGMLLGGPLIAAIGARSAIVLAGLVVTVIATAVAAFESRRKRPASPPSTRRPVRQPSLLGQ
jgi:predicted MFS family arabinose efflux permease